MFIPPLGVVHLVSAVDIAKIIIGRNEEVNINIVIMKMPFDSGFAALAKILQNDAPEYINQQDLPSLNSSIINS